MDRSPSEIRTPWTPSASVLCFGLTVLVLAVFGRTLSFDFTNYDDNTYVYENPAVTAGLTLDGLASAFTSTDANLWTPLTRISHMVDCQLYGLHPWGHHLSNLLLHLASALLLFLLLLHWTGKSWCSVLVAALFAIHPLRAESVAWVSERKDVLCGFFFILCLWAYTFHVTRPGRRRYYAALLFFYILSLLAKGMAVTLPFLLLLIDHWPLRRIGAGELFQWKRIPEKLPLLLLALLSVWIAFFDPFGWNPPTAAHNTPPPLELRLENALLSYGIYLGQTFWPVNLAVRYPFPENGVPLIPMLLSGLLLTGVSVFVWRWRWNRPHLLVGWLWFLGMLAPVMQIIPLGMEAHCDRYTYLPQIGLWLALVWGGAELVERFKISPRYTSVILGLILITLASLTWHQTGYWKNNLSLWTQTLGHTDVNPVAENNLGAELAARGQPNEAMVHYQKALEIKPDYADAHNNVGIILASKGRWDEAIAHYQKAIEINPSNPTPLNNLGCALQGKGQLDEAIACFQKVLKIEPNHAMAHNNLANVLAARGLTNQAVAHYEKAVQIQPLLANTHHNLGLALMTLGRFDEAIEHYEKALEIKPDYADSHINLGNALQEKSRLDEAIFHYQKALEINPQLFLGRYNLALALQHKGDTGGAIVNYEKALAIDPDHILVLKNYALLLASCREDRFRNGTRALALAQQAKKLTQGRDGTVLLILASAYAETGRFPEALREAATAREIALSQSNSGLAALIEQHLNLYKTGKPLRTEP